MEVVGMLIEETKEMNEKMGYKFDVASSLNAYISHFACYNHFLNQKYQDDISRYVFSKEYNIQPYPGCYGDFPRKWIEKVNIIAYTIENIKKKAQSKAERENNG